MDRKALTQASKLLGEALSLVQDTTNDARSEWSERTEKWQEVARAKNATS